DLSCYTWQNSYNWKQKKLANITGLIKISCKIIPELRSFQVRPERNCYCIGIPSLHKRMDIPATSPALPASLHFTRLSVALFCHALLKCTTNSPRLSLSTLDR